MQHPPIRPAQASLAVSVLDPEMVNKQARRREPFLRAAAAENGIDDDGDVNEAAQGEAWTCTKCETSNGGMESQCTNCNARYVAVQSGPVKGWEEATFAESLGNKWKCENCLAFNDDGVDTCAACEVPHEGGNIDGDGGGTASTGSTTTTAVTSTLVIGANGFSLGGVAPSSTTTAVSVGGPAPVATSTATSSSSAPVTTGGFSLGGAFAMAVPTTSTAPSTTSSSSAPVTVGGFVVDVAFAAAVPTTASITAADDDNNETSSGMHLGDFASTSTVSGDSMDDVRASGKESRKRKRGADEADDENVARELKKQKGI